MAFGFSTYDNRTGGDPLFKALGHPMIRDRAQALVDSLAMGGPVALVDPWGQLACFAEYFDLAGVEVVGRFVQRIEEIEAPAVGARWPTLPMASLGASGARTVLVAAFDARATTRAAAWLAPAGAKVVGFDDLRLPVEMLSNRQRYLDPLNFATNFCLFRAGAGRHTALRMVEYWRRYGAAAPKLWLKLFDDRGKALAEWTHEPARDQAVTIDAEAVRRRFGLGAFMGSLFIHAVGIQGHDVLKYVLDDIDEARVDPAVTHDSNSWPADRYAGLPAPDAGERVVLYLQNCHPVPIPSGAMRLVRMGGDAPVPITTEVAPFGTLALDVGALFPDLRWPDQIEILSDRHVGRPRYEIELANGTVTLAHANVERSDLSPDPKIAALPRDLFGQGYLLTAPVLPRDRWRSYGLPTPMATGQAHLPLAVTIYDEAGAPLLRHALGNLPRDHRTLVDVEALLDGAGVGDGFTGGHMEFAYDFSVGAEADGWIHGLFRYVHVGGQIADTSFGSHIFNTVSVYKGEPQSYAGRPPGLSTRLHLRLATRPLATGCCLIYPASADWRPTSDTRLSLFDQDGRPIAERALAIPMRGSRFLRIDQLFDEAELGRAGADGYVVITDDTCRLFGYHLALAPDGGFCLDHMFGF